jgi:hypothetical protein
MTSAGLLGLVELFALPPGQAYPKPREDGA